MQCSRLHESVQTTRFLLIRHAHVRTGNLCGWLDLPLSAQGKAQLEALQQPPGPPPDALYASPLLRTRATADAVGRLWNLDPVIEPGLREISCGNLEGESIEKLQSEQAELWARNMAQDDPDFCWPGGESYRGFRERVVATLTSLARCHPGETVVLVTHTGVVSQLIGQLEGISPARWDHHRPTPLSATELLWHDDAPRQLLSFSRQNWWQQPVPI